LEKDMIGKLISHYRILEKLGEGGMGEVYLAEDLKLERKVSIKFLPQHLTKDKENVERFKREAKAAAALNHPNIVTIHDVIEANDPTTADMQICIVMEYVDGESLRIKINNGFSKLAEILDITNQICDGLSEAHEADIVHRDIKPENILIDKNGRVKILDFGLAKLRGVSKLTKETSTLGTIHYMSPEQIQGQEVDHRSDIWSLGVVLYEMLTVQLPFKGEYESAIIYSILNEEQESIQNISKDIPSKLQQVVIKTLEKDPEKRYQHINNVLTDLKSIKKQSESERRSLQSSQKLRTSSTGKKMIVFGSIFILFIILAILSYLFIHSKPSYVQNRSIAVLPFKNLSDSKDDEYFSDGITEDILTQLSKISDLKVISCTTIMQYKNTKKSIREIGKELNVGVVLEGSVRHSGDRIRISSQLIDAKEDKHLWAETYDREMKDVFAIQSDVAKHIAAAMRTELSPTERERIERIYTKSTEAYRLYLKGRFYWNKRTDPDLQKAIDYFNQAIEKDTDYALAYQGLADSYLLLPQHGLAATENFNKAQQAAVNALKLDSTLAEVHAVLGALKASQSEWGAAENEFKRAIELNPSNPTVHHWYSMFLLSLGRLNESNTEARRAVELDPLSLIINLNLGMNLFYLRQFDQAVDQCQKAIDLDPYFPWSYYVMGSVAEARGKFDEAAMQYQKARTLAHNDLTLLGEIGRSYARAGKKDEAMKILKELQDHLKQGYSVSFAIANVYLGLGNREETFNWLEKSLQDDIDIYMDIRNSPIWDSIRTDQRFITLMKKIGPEK
jgi:serine/threonine protein kinase/Tfp pilus assembly protein PilF